MAGHIEQCALCGLSYYTMDGSIDVGEDYMRYFRCPDTISCAERWLVKFLAGRRMDLESIRLMSDDPNAAPQFEVLYQVPDAGSRRRTFTLEICLDEDIHRRFEHYHVLENGRDMTTHFVP
jgi:hypothetical protein